ncbi:MAG: pirin family protein [Desulfuromonadaceae bacterium]|nr:pirin family protein [Desulfuromonadaceae bacterium]
MSTRRIAKIFKSQPTVEGAGVHLKRAFGYAQVPLLDPFLMLDDFHTSIPGEYLAGFPWHPHRGIETITYIFEGLVEHGDSMGNTGVISAGDVQWMTAGSGIIHQEMPKESPTGTMWGLQFWANLPADQKMMHPRYRDVKAADIPEITLEGGVLAKIIAGTVDGVQGPVKDIVIEPEMLDIYIPADSVFRHTIQKGHTAFIYILSGEGRFDESGDICQNETLLLFERSGDAVKIETDGTPARFMLVSGKPLGEPVAWGGPIVMNTQEELQTAFDEFNTGTFIKRD